MSEGTINLIDGKVGKYYKNVTMAELAPFIDFRKSNPLKKLKIQNVEWQYLDTGSGKNTIVLMTGALGMPIIDWRHINYFSQQFRLLAPSYPPLPSMEALVDGIADLMVKAGVHSVQIWGGSYGGMVAQVFVRKYPQLTEKLILSHTLPPNPETGKSLTRMLKWMQILPGFLLRWLLNRSLSRLMPENEEGMALTYAIYNEIMHTHMDKENIVALFKRTIDYSTRHFTPDDLANWQGSVLLMLSKDDPSTPDETRQLLQTIYPDARVHLFQGTGHATSLLQENAYREVIESFIKN
jgi:pimeloyl-ACP methyl ester carboxylesterase